MNKNTTPAMNTHTKREKTAEESTRAATTCAHMHARGISLPLRLYIPDPDISPFML